MNGRFATVFRLVFLCGLLLGLATVGFAQGRGHGGGVGGGRGVGGGSGIGGPPAGVGVERGLGRSSDASAGRADRGRGNASDKSNGRSDEGLNRARTASGNLKQADQELRDNPGIARTLHTSANNLRSQYQAALATNPNLKFGQFVAATRLAQNLGARHPNITRNAILAGLASGKSIGQTLQSLGLSQRDAKDAKNQAEREIKRGRK
jgi:hypothetical protein